MSAPTPDASVTGAVTEVREGHRIDVTSLARFRTGRLPGVEHGLTVRQFEGGQRQGNASSLYASDVGAQVDVFADTGRRVAEGQGA